MSKEKFANTGVLTTISAKEILEHRKHKASSHAPTLQEAIDNATDGQKKQIHGEDLDNDKVVRGGGDL